MDTPTRTQFAEAGRKKLEEFRRKKAAEKTAAAADADALKPTQAETISQPLLNQPTATTHAAAASGGSSNNNGAPPPPLHYYEAAPTSSLLSGSINKESLNTFSPSSSLSTLPVAAAVAIKSAREGETPYSTTTTTTTNTVVNSTIKTTPPPTTSATTTAAVLEKKGESSTHLSPSPPQPFPFFPATTAAAPTVPAVRSLPKPETAVAGVVERPLAAASSQLLAATAPSAASPKSTSFSSLFKQTAAAPPTESQPHPTKTMAMTPPTKEEEEEEEEHTIISIVGVSCGSVADADPISAPPPPASFQRSTSISSLSDQILKLSASTNALNALGNSTTAATTAAAKSKDFKELQRHIGELTEEKFTLQRCVEQQTALADRLAAENEALTAQVNSSARAAEEALKELEVRRKEVGMARMAVGDAMAERDAYQMSCREAADRANGLAVEVVTLEEKLLKMKSEELKRMSEREREREEGGGDGRGRGGRDDKKMAAAAAAENVEMEKKVIDLKLRLEDSQRQVEVLKKERNELKEDLSAARTEIERLSQLNEELRRQQQQQVEGEGEVLRSDSSISADTRSLPQMLPSSSISPSAAAAAVDSSWIVVPSEPPLPPSLPPSASVETTAQRSGGGVVLDGGDLENKESSGNVSLLHPPISASLAGEAMVHAATATTAATAVESSTDMDTLTPTKDENINTATKDKQVMTMPIEIRALLPEAAWMPGADALDSGINSLVERIYSIVDVLAVEKEEAEAALVAEKNQVKVLKERIEALEAKLVVVSPSALLS